MKKIYLIVMGVILFFTSMTIIIVNNINNNKQYLVTFDSNGGTAVESKKVKRDELVSKPEDPTMEGYQFIEWTYEDKHYDFSSEVTSNITLVAKWQKLNEEVETFVIKFDSTGGTTISNQIIEKGNKVKSPVVPIKEGYTFIEWQLNGEKYDFEKEVSSDLELVAVYEEIKPVGRPNTNTNTNKPSNNTGTTPKPNTNIQNTTKPDPGNQDTNPGNTIKLPTPTITIPPMGGESPDGTIGGYLQLDKVKGEVEIYYAESTSGKYQLLRTATSADHGTNNYEVSVPLGKHYYFKVRLKSNGVYSEYSNVLDFDNTLPTPTITIPPMGGESPDGTIGGYLQLDKVKGEVEIYYAESTSGKYQLLRTATSADHGTNNYEVSVPLGKHYYFKVRLKANGEYSGYSNILDFDNSLPTPTITIPPMGGESPDGTIGGYLQLDKVKGEVEIYYAESESGEYQLLRTATTSDHGTNNYEVSVPLGKHYYFKVRLKANGVYSGYSNILDFDNSN